MTSAIIVKIIPAVIGVFVWIDVVFRYIATSAQPMTRQFFHGPMITARVVSGRIGYPSVHNTN